MTSAVVSGARVRRAPRRDDGGAKGKRLAAGAAIVTCLGLLAVVVYASVTSTAWRLGGYTVRGASYLTAQEVLAAAGLRLVATHLSFDDPVTGDRRHFELDAARAAV